MGKLTVLFFATTQAATEEWPLTVTDSLVKENTTTKMTTLMSS